VRFGALGAGSSDVRCLITTVSAEYATGVGTTEMDAMLAALDELQAQYRDRDEGLISEKPDV